MNSKRKLALNHTESTLESFLEEEKILEEVGTNAVKRVIAWQLENAMKEQRLSKRARHGTATVDDAVNHLQITAEVIGELLLRHTQRLEELFIQNLSRSGRLSPNHAHIDLLTQLPSRDRADVLPGKFALSSVASQKPPAPAEKKRTLTLRLAFFVPVSIDKA